MCVRALTQNSDQAVTFLRGVVKCQRALRVGAVHELPVWGEGEAHYVTGVDPAKRELITIKKK